MPDKYEIKFFKNEREISISELPKEYLQGIIEICKNEIVSNNRLERVYKGMVKQEHATPDQE